MLYDYEKERQEALSAGNKALVNLRQAQDCLEDARKWGFFDIISGGLISTLIKHKRMEKAKGYISAAKGSLHLFEKELHDLTDFQNINLETQDFLGIADLFFDGVVADILMQSRINDARSELARTINKVKDIMRKL